MCPQGIRKGFMRCPSIQKSLVVDYKNLSGSLKNPYRLHELLIKPFIYLTQGFIKVLRIIVKRVGAHQHQIPFQMSSKKMYERV